MANSGDISSIAVGVHPEHPSLAPAVASADVDGAARLFRLAKLAEELASSQIADEARQLAGRISEGRFYVACIGQFKRGKSTLINALIGDPVLPVGFTPVKMCIRDSFDDVRKLLDVLHRLTDLGNTVIIIEHNLDVIRNADWILDLGPEGGEEGGRIVAQGTPEQVARVKKSYTGQALTAYFNGSEKSGTPKNGSANSGEVA